MARPRSPENTDRKQRIIDAAIKCFIQNGVAKTRLKEVAQEAKIDQPLIHYYFSDLDALYSEIVNVVLEDLRNRSVRSLGKGKTDPLSVLIEYVKGTLSWPREKPGYFSIWIYFYYLSSFNPKFYSLNKTIRETGRARIEMMIYKGLEQKLFTLPKKISVSDAALNIQGLLTGNAIIAATEGPEFPIKKIEEQTLEAIFYILGVS